MLHLMKIPLASFYPGAMNVKIFHGPKKTWAKSRNKIDLLNIQILLRDQVLSHRKLGTRIIMICMSCSLLPVHSCLTSITETGSWVLSFCFNLVW